MDFSSRNQFKTKQKCHFMHHVRNWPRLFCKWLSKNFPSLLQRIAFQLRKTLKFSGTELCRTSKYFMPSIFNSLNITSKFKKARKNTSLSMPPCKMWRGPVATLWICLASQNCKTEDCMSLFYNGIKREITRCHICILWQCWRTVVSKLQSKMSQVQWWWENFPADRLCAPVCWILLL